MSFRLCNAPATFQRAMDKIIDGENRKFAIPYLYDIIVFSESHVQHDEHLEIILTKLKLAGLALNRKKCHFSKPEFMVLGNIISGGSVKPDPAKTKAIEAYEFPQTVKEMRSFLGLVNYCREFIPKYAQLAKPLFDTLRGETKKSMSRIDSSPELLKAFRGVKDKVAANLVRAQLNFGKKFILTTDASDVVIGAALSQLQSDGQKK